MVNETKQFRKRKDLAVITACMDKPEKLDDAYNLIKQYGIDGPIVWTKEWEPLFDNKKLSYRGVPSAFIIDPQGKVMPNVYAGEGIGDKLKCLLDNVERLPEVQMKWNCDAPQDGKVKFSLYCAGQPSTSIEVHLSADKLVYVYGEVVDGEWQQIDPIPEGKHPTGNTLKEISGFQDLVRTVTFDESKQAVLTLEVPIDDDAYKIDARAKLLIPKTESYQQVNRNDETVEGIWLTESARVTARKPDWQ